MKILLLLLLLLTVGSVSAEPTLIPPTENLYAWYTSYNHSYFQDSLPAKVVITRNLKDDRFMAITEYTNGYYHIEFNTKYSPSPKQERMTLLHEQCHIRLAIEDQGDFGDHGEAWQHCMHDVSKQGGFESLW
jgi:predicted SprT family Zn-dependent metalloprotease